MGFYFIEAPSNNYLPVVDSVRRCNKFFHDISLVDVFIWAKL